MQVLLAMIATTSAIALAAAALVPVAAQTRRDPPSIATAPSPVEEPSPLQGVPALKIDMSAPSIVPQQPLPVSDPLPESPLQGAHPLQNGGGK